MRKIYSGIFLLVFFFSCGRPSGETTQNAMPVEYFVQREIGRQLRVMLADTNAGWDSASSHHLVNQYLSAVDEFDKSFFSMIGAGIQPSPPCTGCDDIRSLLAAPGDDWSALQVLDYDMTPLAGFRLRANVSGGALIEPDLADGKDLPEQGFLRVPNGDGFMDIAMKFAR